MVERHERRKNHEIVAENKNKNEKIKEKMKEGNNAVRKGIPLRIRKNERKIYS